MAEEHFDLGDGFPKHDVVINAQLMVFWKESRGI
jgi:hypothetical protein